jgi:hypothetical protein
VGSLGGNLGWGLGKELGKEFLERKEKRDKFGMIIIMDKVTETDWT